ncbi:MAG: ExbD/TolR family protein [Hyphomicrobiaceae bacterium]
MGASIKTGGGGGGRRRRGGRGRAHMPMSEINVTPFVDVMLVLLIIFMVAAPLLTAGVPLELPQAKGKALDAQQREPVVVSVTKDGKIFLGQEDKTSLSLDELVSKLQAMAEARGSRDDTIFLRGDTLAHHGLVTQVLARIKLGGFNKVSIVIEGEPGG